MTEITWRIDAPEKAAHFWIIRRIRVSRAILSS